MTRGAACVGGAFTSCNRVRPSRGSPQSGGLRSRGVSAVAHAPGLTVFEADLDALRTVQDRRPDRPCIWLIRDEVYMRLTLWLVLWVAFCAAGVATGGEAEKPDPDGVPPAGAWAIES